MPKNSAPIMINKQEILIKSRIKKNTECTVFFEAVTIIAETIAIKENVLIGCFTNKKYAPMTISGIKSNTSISQKTITNASRNDS